MGNTINQAASTVEEMLPFTDSTSLLDNASALRHQMQQEGYLFVRALLPATEVKAVYEDIAAICQKHGWMDAAGLALGEPAVEGSPAWEPIYDDVQRLESFHALAHHPRFLEVVETLVQEPVLVHPRNIARISYPRATYFTTPSHQDYVLIQGTPETYTMWMPLLDCPVELGSLAVLAGSHRVGVLPVHAAQGAGGIGITTHKLGLLWHTSSFSAGDMLLFHSHTIHKAFPNVTGNQLRISVDYRYQGVSQPIVEDGLQPHYGRLTWGEIYQGWSRRDLQYYWKNLSIHPVARDPSLREEEH